ncbi:MAG: hypothetical protein ACRDUV_08950 [Pseudonocardiaceae bacterium]
MTATQETVTDATRRGQDATISVLDAWADIVKKMVGSFPTPDGKIPDTAEVVDKYFDYVEHILATQREFAKNMMAVTTSAASKAASAAQDAAKDMQEPAKNAAAKKS